MRIYCVPYFYQRKFKRINSVCFEKIERMQKQVLVERFRNSKIPTVYGYFGTDLVKKEVEFDDFKLVEKEDWIKFRTNSYLENSKSAIEMLKRFYYLDNLEWLVIETNHAKLNTKAEIISDNNIRKLTISKLTQKYCITLSLIGLHRLQEPLNNYAENLKSIGISQIHLLFCSKNLQIQVPYHLVLNSIYNNQVLVKRTDNCFSYTYDSMCGLLYPKKRKINSIRKANNYLMNCSRTLGVDLSWIKRGDLFHYAIFDPKNNNFPNWERIELLFGNYFIPMNEKLQIPSNVLTLIGNEKKKMNILQFIFWNILKIAKRFGLADATWHQVNYTNQLEIFEKNSIVVEYKNRIGTLLSHVDERMFRRLQKRDFSFVKMVKDFDIFNELNVKQTSQKKSNFKPFKWYDFVIKSIGTKSQNPTLVEREIVSEERTISSLQYLFMIEIS